MTQNGPTMTLFRNALLGALAVVLAACGVNAGPQFDDYDEAAYAGAICTDNGWTRVPDHYCPIGDGEVDGQQYFWRYRPYAAATHDIDVVYVGYPVDRTVWVVQRPARVSTLHIDRGSFPEQPLAGQPRTSSARVVTAAERAKTVQRGGLGSTTAATRTATAVTDAKAVAKRSIAPPPSGKRAMAAAKSTSKSGGRK